MAIQKVEEQPLEAAPAAETLPEPRPERFDPNAVLAVHAAGKDDRCVAPKCHGELWPCAPAQSAQRLQSLGA